MWAFTLKFIVNSKVARFTVSVVVSVSLLYALIAVWYSPWLPWLLKLLPLLGP
jgi:hypothetical protein